MSQKQYGLIRLSKNATKSTLSTGLAKKPSIFGESDDSDSDSASIPQIYSSNKRKQAQAKISQAIVEDPNIFQYDEVYDEMKSTSASNQKQNAKIVEKKSRYIGNMLKHKDLREKEQELREERKIQKEREMEGEEFKDKEAFVTSAYKDKLKELKQAREDFEKQDDIENMLDVTKQSDLNGFYRSMFRNDLFNEQEDTSEQNDQSVKFNKKVTTQKKVNLRERNLSEDEDEENEDTENSIAPAEVPNVTTDKISERTASEETANNDRISKSIEPPSEMKESDTNQTTIDNEKKEIPTATKNPSEENLNEKEQTVLPAPKKPKIDRAELIRRMFTKRTVNEAFEAARNRYLERKALRQL